MTRDEILALYEDTRKKCFAAAEDADQRPRTKRRWNPNIQRVKAIVNGVTPKRLNVCTSCLKAGKVAR